ncbi:hypothetical protein G4Y79_22230 [Phototrophicus methaneseepsis]|uniref:Uncharacterized protein n=1 Tax=Phototrophicus methaneseepsis TaxID=2710758 RepID=A0A7S8E8T8_9CHLR|nr:hypothetical protein [Phototrophicus methaneseepsis]QPC82369.1 hypothetical protein G4Y79_22230 [Phototrophicus methaneseepsis]
MEEKKKKNQGRPCIHEIVLWLLDQLRESPVLTLTIAFSLFFALSISIVITVNIVVNSDLPPLVITGTPETMVPISPTLIPGMVTPTLQATSTLIRDTDFETTPQVTGTACSFRLSCFDTPTPTGTASSR